MNALKEPGLCSAPSKSGSTQKVCSSNITVVVRVRPANAKELEQNNRIVVDVVDDTLLVFDPKEEIRPFFYQGVQQPNKNYLKRANKELQFVFDQVFDQTASNKDVFEATTKGMLESLMEGYNCSVFVYGATGAGKTFTMIGSQLYPGITYLTMEHLFYTIHSFEEDREFDIGVSYIEIYNEHVYDLLKPSKLALQLREDNKYGVMVAGLTLHKINTARELLNMLENGNKNRTQHPTDANAESSRSHAVFQVYVKMRYKTSSQVRLVKLSMIDLAGSERAAATGCVGDRFKEGANINRSLLSLGNCINRLADGSNYIPYRDSKLTRLLKDSLGGNCKTIMIANVSPSSISYEDTYNTLKYAARANKIQLSLKKNIVDGDMKISQYVKINAELKKKVKDLEAKLAQASYSGVQAQSVHVEDGRAQKWRDRILMEEKSYGGAETRLLALMARARVLALRHRLRTRGAARVADLAHRSSTEAMNQIYNEDVPRQERAAEHYIKQSLNLEMTIHQEWVKWKELRQNLHIACERGLAQCPDLKEFITLIHSQSNERQWIAKNDLKDKLLTICYKEISAFTDYTIEMPNMLKKLYMTLKGHNFLPPTMTSEYLEIMKKAKSSKAITWSDTDTVSESTDHELKYICTLDLNQPISTSLLTSAPKQSSSNGTDSDLTDVENQDTNVETSKRKGTPIKLLNNETIIIDDSLEVLDASRVLNSAKKIKIDFDESSNKENNYDNGVINPKDLNSTFVLNGKMENPNKNQVNTEPPMHRGLTDRTNTIHRNFIFNDKGVRAKAVGKALPQRRPAAPAQGPRVAGFGSSLARDGTPLQRNAFGRNANVTMTNVGYKAVRERARTPVHPYSRPAARK